MATQPHQIPANFNSVVYDFLTDLSTTFPEYAFLWKKWQTPEMSEESKQELFSFFHTVFPERFFDILYQNDDIFLMESETNTVFLPNVDFKLFFHCANITENTRKAIWKYLQLILISVLGSVKNRASFGDAASLFEGFDESVIQEKLSETIESIGEFFKNLGPKNTEGEPSEGAHEFDPSKLFSGEIPTPEKMAEMEEEIKRTFQFAEEGAEEGAKMPSAEDLHEHLKGLFDGKIGSLAKEMAEEITEDMKNLFETDGTEDIKSTQDILKKMLKNPKKMMDLMKTIGTKLQNKMKTGDITEEEIMKEASELMGKMKGMGGGKGGFADMMKNMAQGLAGGKAKFNTGAFNRMEKKMAAKERMLFKMEQKRNEKEAQQQVKYSLNATNTPDNYVFKLEDEEVQETSVLSKSAPQVDIDALAREIEGPNGGIATSGGAANKKKSKKSKK
jgi:hypothetical protein